MLLVAQVALGVVLGIFIVAYLREIVASAIILSAIAVGIGLVVVVGLVAEPHVKRTVAEIGFENIVAGLGFIVLGWLALGRCIAIYRYFERRGEPLLDEESRRKDSQRSGWKRYVHGYVALWLAVGAAGAIFDYKPQPEMSPLRWWLILIMMICAWACLHLLIELADLFFESRRRWRVKRRKEIDAVAAAGAPGHQTSSAQSREMRHGGHAE